MFLMSFNSWLRDFTALFLFLEEFGLKPEIARLPVVDVFCGELSGRSLLPSGQALRSLAGRVQVFALLLTSQSFFCL